MPTLRSVHATVSRWLRRGNVFDIDVPDAVRMAARSIERNYTLKYMETYVTFTIPAVAIEPRAINFPDTKVKKIQFLKIRGADGEFRDLTAMDPRDLKVVETGEPRRYWLDGNDYIWFDSTPDKDYQAEMFYDRYTTWPTSADSTVDPPFDWLDSKNWLIENADDCLAGHALSHMKILARLPMDMRQSIDELVSRSMGELLRADQELRTENTSYAMNYGRVY